MLSDDYSLSSLETDNEWYEEEWEALLPSEDDRKKIIEWMASICPSNVLLHSDILNEYETSESMWNNYEKRLWERLETKFPNAHRIFSEKRKEFEDEFEDSILSSFFRQYRKPWMVVSNEEVRSAVKTLKNQDAVYDIARVHRTISMADRSMVNITSQILSQTEPDPFWILEGLRSLDLSSESIEDAYINHGFNMGCARDVLQHLVNYQKTRDESL